MKLPQVHGQNTQTSFYIYAACDTEYFKQFAPSLINSVLSNTNQGLHLHLFNPTQDQINLCQQPRVSATWEFVDAGAVQPFVSNFTNLTDNQQRRTRTAMTKGNDKDLADRLLKTYYACARFIRLGEQFHEQAFAIDVDAVVRKPIPQLLSNVDFYLHRIFGKKARCLAGGLYLNTTAKRFLDEYAAALKDKITNNCLYWGVDQDLLDTIVTLHSHGQLPLELIDWEMTSAGIIWTAKGTRKDLEIFINEQKKYIV